MATAKPIPDGFHTVTPYLTVHDAGKEIDFLKRALGATEIFVMRRPDGGVMHAELKIGNSILMVGEARGQWEPTKSSIYLYVEDADSLYQRALKAGATGVQEMADQFYGDRTGAVKDTAGNMWWVATHKEDVSEEELQRRAQKMYTQAAHAAG